MADDNHDPDQDPPVKKKFTFKRAARPAAAVTSATVGTNTVTTSSSISGKPDGVGKSTSSSLGDRNKPSTSKPISTPAPNSSDTHSSKAPKHVISLDDDDDDSSFFLRSQTTYKSLVEEEIFQKKRKSEEGLSGREDGGADGTTQRSGGKKKGRRREGSVGSGVSDDDDDRSSDDGRSGSEMDLDTDEELGIRSRKERRKKKSMAAALTISDDDDEDGRGREKRGGSKSHGSQGKPRRRKKSLTPPPQIISPTLIQPASTIPTQPHPTTTITTSQSIAPIVLSDSDPDPPSDTEKLKHPTSHSSRTSTSTSTATNSVTNPKPPLPSKVIDILITSPLPDTRSLLVKRRSNQRFKEVRLAWCGRNGFAEKEKEIFLTYKGKVVFDSNTCNSILQNLLTGRDGVFDDGEEGKVADEEIQVHLEAVNDEWYKKLKSQLENPEQSKQAHNPDNGDGDDELSVVSSTLPAQAHNQQQQRQQSPNNEDETMIRLILKAKGFEEYKIKVRPETKVSRMVTVFAAARKVDLSQKKVSLVFDGEELDEDGIVGDTELEDMDGVDVHIKDR